MKPVKVAAEAAHLLTSSLLVGTTLYIVFGLLIGLILACL